jgi:hypothetical protein
LQEDVVPAAGVEARWCGVRIQFGDAAGSREGRILQGANAAQVGHAVATQRCHLTARELPVADARELVDFGQYVVALMSGTVLASDRRGIIGTGHE